MNRRQWDVLGGQISCMLGMACVFSGMQYMVEGSGLHPLLAGSLATIFLLAPFLIMKDSKY